LGEETGKDHTALSADGTALGAAGLDRTSSVGGAAKVWMYAFPNKLAGASRKKTQRISQVPISRAYRKSGIKNSLARPKRAIVRKNMNTEKIATVENLYGRLGNNVGSGRRVFFASISS
jgi:hypothetical protein